MSMHKPYLYRELQSSSVNLGSKSENHQFSQSLNQLKEFLC